MKTMLDIFLTVWLLLGILLGIGLGIGGVMVLIEWIKENRNE